MNITATARPIQRERAGSAVETDARDTHIVELDGIAETDVHDRIGIGIRIKRRIEGEMSGGTSGEIGGCSAGGVVKTGEETTLDKKSRVSVDISGRAYRDLTAGPNGVITGGHVRQIDLTARLRHDRAGVGVDI